MQKNRRHLIKMHSNFVKSENDNDMDNDRDTEIATETGEVDEPRGNATELRETHTYLDQEEE